MSFILHKNQGRLYQRREISIFLVFDYSGGEMILFDAVVHETFPRENISFCIYVKLIVAK